MRISKQIQHAAIVRLHSRIISIPVNLDGLSEVFSCLEKPMIFGAVSTQYADNRFSYYMADPAQIAVYDDQDTELEPFMETHLAQFKLEDIPNGIPEAMFKGGWCGYFSYDLGRCFEQIPSIAESDLDIPLIWLGLYDKLIAVDHESGLTYLLAIELDDLDHEAKLDWLEELFDKSNRIDTNISFQSCPDTASGGIESVDYSAVKGNMTESEYVEAINRVKQYIYDGDVYQINYAQRFERSFTAEPIKLFRWQNQHNPSPYSAYLDTGDFSIVSASPELFIEIADDKVRTCPIKGTRPRVSGNSKLNSENRKELSDSEKDKAELNMIVDLERNDIARICKPGTREVSKDRYIRDFPTVFHAIAEITGQLKPSMSFYDVLRATFPGGSITGAPKIRAMEIIEELEPTRRGIYTGSIGYLGLDGSVCLNIAIRTVIIRRNRAFVYSGGGIVADSDPTAEWHETLTKARALLAGIEQVQEISQVE